MSTIVYHLYNEKTRFFSGFCYFKKQQANK